MKKTIYALLLVISIIELGCQSIARRDLKVVDFITILDQNFEVGKPNLRDTMAITVIDFDNIRTFVVPFHNERRNTTILPNGNTTEGSTTYDTTFVYCLFEKGSKVGLRYDSLSSVLPKKFPVDSLLNRINIGKEQLYWNAIAEGKLEYSLRNNKTNELIEERYFSKKDATVDSTYRYFNPSMKGVDFTIAPSIDKKYNSKLIKIVNISIKDRIRNVLKTEIKEGDLKEPLPIIKLIERFTKDKQIKLK
ncbi:MAG: hypothetical protein EOO90_25640 [Pedobacter sp.]|nr:MAG: hypothetical protein EOO90_25640 [Pedobacter sp.]